LVTQCRLVSVRKPLIVAAAVPFIMPDQHSQSIEVTLYYRTVINMTCKLVVTFQTPKDKLQCVLRCSTTIMNLLSMANERSVPAADDFMPVLILVLIKSGVTSLMSNVQYVSCFYEKRLTGEEQYWWMQFVSAIEFIKTMDYAD